MLRQQVTRRYFLGTASAAVAGLGRGATAQERPLSPPRHRYIDIHTHLGTFYYGQHVSVDHLVEWMDQHWIERAVILPLVSPEAAPYLQTVESALAAFQAHPDRIIPFCAVDPRAMATAAVENSRPGHVPGLKGLLSILTRYKEAGARGFGEHKVGLPFDHPLMMILYEACQELELPVLFHLDDIRGIDGPGLPRLERALAAFPELPFIGHGAGFWSSISGDANDEDFRSYPQRPITPGGAVDRLMDTYANLYGDLSAPGGATALSRDREFGKNFLLRRADRLLFGTDYLMPKQQIAQFELLASFQLADEVERQIYRGNAIRLLKLDARGS